jgi:hypothetical protein
MAKPEIRKNDEFRMTKSESNQFVIRASSFIRISGFVILVPALGGCASDKHPTTRPSSASDRQEAALKDPFNYSPNMDEDISGGGIGHYDRNAMRKDLDNVLNP